MHTCWKMLRKIKSWEILKNNLINSSYQHEGSNGKFECSARKRNEIKKIAKCPYKWMTNQNSQKTCWVVHKFHKVIWVIFSPVRGQWLNWLCACFSDKSNRSDDYCTATDGVKLNLLISSLLMYIHWQNQIWFCWDLLSKVLKINTQGKYWPCVL